MKPRRRPLRNIWAPWRIEYILGARDKGCFLCRKFRAKDDDANHVLFRGRTCAVIMNRYPYATGHLMVAPYRHVADVTGLTAAESAEMMRLAQKCVTVLRRAMKPDGLNLGINLGAAAGAGLKDHLHLHVVPRWTGDTNFMPVLADVKIMPQSLDEVARALRPKFRRR